MASYNKVKQYLNDTLNPLLQSKNFYIYLGCYAAGKYYLQALSLKDDSTINMIKLNISLKEAFLIIESIYRMLVTCTQDNLYLRDNIYRVINKSEGSEYKPQIKVRHGESNTESNWMSVSRDILKGFIYII